MSRSDESDGLAALRQALADHAPDLAVEHLARFRPATALVPHRVSSADDIPIGASRLNGEPDLPPDMTWPSWDGPPGEASTRGGPAWLPPHHWGPRPLTFLAQINLAELPPAARSIPLPNDGWLLFFADQDRSTFYSGEEQAAQRVIHLPAGTHLERRSLPQDVRYGRSEDGTWPGYGAPASIAHRTISTPPYDDLYRLVDGLDPAGARELAHVLYATSIASDSFQLGGWPVPIQEDPLRSTPHMVRSLAESDPGTWSELADPAVEWVLLFQYVTDRSLDMMLGDEGNLYFMAAMPDLERGDFSRVVVEFQCS
jgi:uncharacterized protein YwqG